MSENSGRPVPSRSAPSWGNFMSQPFRTRGRSDEPWEQGLYFLLLLVALVVILYSLFGIATLLGYFPLSQKAVGANPLQTGAAIDRIKEGPLSENMGGIPCVRRAGINVPGAAGTGAMLDASLSGCVEAGGDPRASRGAMAPALSKGH